MRFSVEWIEGGTNVWWDEVCVLHSEGGLSLRHLQSWNATIFMKLSSFWWFGYVPCGWHGRRSISYVAGRFGGLNLAIDDPGVFKTFSNSGSSLFIKVDNGRNCCARFNPWLPGGSILSHFPEHVIYDATSSVDAKVVEFLTEKGD